MSPNKPLAPQAIDIPIEQVRKLAALGCTQPEMADFFECDLTTLERRLMRPEYRTAYAAGVANMKISLRRKQLEMALAGNVGCLIWLGKQHLGQKERHDFLVTPGGNVEAGADAVELFESRITQLASRLRAAGLLPLPPEGGGGAIPLQLEHLGETQPTTPTR